MADEATLTLTLDTDLRDRFAAEAEMAMRPADDVLRDLVRGFVDGRQAARDAEVDRALREADDPGTIFVSDEEVETEWRAERAALLRRIGESAA